MYYVISPPHTKKMLRRSLATVISENFYHHLKPEINNIALFSTVNSILSTTYGYQILKFFRRGWQKMTNAISFHSIYSSMVCNECLARDCINISYSCCTMSNHPMVRDRIEGFLLEKQKLSCNKAR